MANWILFARDSSGQPVVSAMKGGELEESINSVDRTQLINFLKKLSGAGTFLVAKPSEPTEAVDRLPEDDQHDSASTTPSTSATWFQFLRDNAGQPVVVAMHGTTGVEKYKGNSKETLISFLSSHAGASTFLVAPDATPSPGAKDYVPPPPVVIPPGKRVLLEIGHGPGTTFDPGAIAPDGTTEHTLNTIAASAARDVLAQAGVLCTVIDTPQGSLHDIGLQAKDFDVFCSVHHNAANQSAQGSEVLVHETKHDPVDRKLAAMISKEMATELGIRDRGVKGDRRLAVLSGAEDTNVRAAVLAEVYFMDVPGVNLKDWSTRGGKAIGRAILKWL